MTMGATVNTMPAIGNRVPYVYEGFELKFGTIIEMPRDDEDDVDLCCYEMDNGDMVTGYEIRQAQATVNKLVTATSWQYADIGLTAVGVIVSTALVIGALWYQGYHWL